jgi:Dihydroxyacetone kinase
MEQLIVYRAAVKELERQGIEVVANFVGEMLTVQEQAGFQMFMARMDDELLRLWNAPCNHPVSEEVTSSSFPLRGAKGFGSPPSPSRNGGARIRRRSPHARIPHFRLRLGRGARLRGRGV